MANFFQNLKAGAQDLVGGVTGQQTGEMIELEWVCEAPALGLRLRKSETPQFLCAERDEVMHAAEARLLADSPVIPIYFYTSKYLVKPYVTGFEGNPLDIYYSKDLAIEP